MGFLAQIKKIFFLGGSGCFDSLQIDFPQQRVPPQLHLWEIDLLPSRVEKTLQPNPTDSFGILHLAIHVLAPLSRYFVPEPERTPERIQAEMYHFCHSQSLEDLWSETFLTNIGENLGIRPLDDHEPIVSLLILGCGNGNSRRWSRKNGIGLQNMCGKNVVHFNQNREFLEGKPISKIFFPPLNWLEPDKSHERPVADPLADANLADGAIEIFKLRHHL